MNRQELIQQIRSKSSFLCVGLDTDLKKIPSFLHVFPDPVFEFNKRIIDATKDCCVAYKLNTAFYECLGVVGWESLAKTLDYIPKEHFTIADAKRGDIGNTSTMYARTFFETMDFDAVTVAPYMGHDSVEPFLAFEDKWVILLGLTSNSGSQDFQHLQIEGERLFERVLKTATTWGNPGNLMFVAGATQAELFSDLRKIAPEHFFLVPGVGAQGGSLERVAEHGLTEDCGLLVNSSRGIIYQGTDEDFDSSAREAAKKMQQEMESLMSQPQKA